MVNFGNGGNAGGTYPFPGLTASNTFSIWLYNVSGESLESYGPGSSAQITFT